MGFLCLFTPSYLSAFIWRVQRSEVDQAQNKEVSTAARAHFEKDCFQTSILLAQIKEAKPTYVKSSL